MSVIDDNLDFYLTKKTIENECYHIFEQKIKTIQDAVTKLLEDAFKTQKMVFSGTINISNEDELQILLDKNKQLQHEISIRMGDVENRQIKYETVKKANILLEMGRRKVSIPQKFWNKSIDSKNQKLLSQEIKGTHEAFLMAKKFYKKYLKMYYTIDKKINTKQTIYVQFFTESKKESENYSVRLLHDTKTGLYELLSTTPNLGIQKELQRRLQETNDVPELLCCVRQAFVVMKTSKTK